LRRFWDLADHHVGEDVPSYDEAGRTLGGLLCSAVSNQMVADVEVGSLLSGGLDSSLLTRIMVERGGNRGRGLAAYSIVYDDPEVDESRFSDAVVGEGGLRGLKERLNPGEAFRTCDQVVLAQGEPLLGYELIAQYHAFGLARRHGTRVVLDGQGADEILGGYPFYEGVRLRELLSQGALGQFWTELASLAAHHRRSRLSILRGHVLGSWRAKLPGARLPTYDWLDLSSVAAPDRGVATEGGPDRSALNRILYHQTKHTNLPAVLQHQDRNSMAHAVESRVPYLDHRIVEFCFRLPPSYKVALGERKRLLREVARPYLPEAILARKDKKAFVSTASWIRLRNQRDPLRGMLGDGALFELPWIRPGPLRRFVEDYLEGRHDDALAVWRLYTAWRWLELCRPGLP
jgi:asparagine synthase (glutamine-hydrolysing)